MKNLSWGVFIWATCKLCKFISFPAIFRTKISVILLESISNWKLRRAWSRPSSVATVPMNPWKLSTSRMFKFNNPAKQWNSKCRGVSSSPMRNSAIE